MDLKSIAQKIKESFHLDEWEEEIALFLLGIAGIIGLITAQKEVAMFCLGALAGYLAKGHVEYRKESQ
jgi:hypothetical protein